MTFDVICLLAVSHWIQYYPRRDLSKGLNITDLGRGTLAAKTNQPFYIVVVVVQSLSQDRKSVV